jgi:hypothetical protein
MSLGDNETLLIQAAAELREKWLNTAAGWQDKAREDFERKHLEELWASAKAAQRATRAIDALLRQAIADCS